MDHAYIYTAIGQHPISHSTQDKTVVDQNNLLIVLNFIKFHTSQAIFL